jgi:hypothetical protein
MKCPLPKCPGKIEIKKTQGRKFLKCNTCSWAIVKDGDEATIQYFIDNGGKVEE